MTEHMVNEALDARIEALEGSLRETKAIAVASLAALSHITGSDASCRQQLQRFAEDGLDEALLPAHLTAGQRELVRQLVEHFATETA